MSYLINSARPSSLTIGGTEYIDSLINFQVSDSSAFRNGVITTTGNIVIGTANGSGLEDYARRDFKRGSPVIFEITYPSGTTAVHPRGRLKVIGSAYDPETEQVVIEVGCDLVMAKLLDQHEMLLPYEQIPLDETTKTYEGISSSLAAAGMLMWQDSAGDLQATRYFDGDLYGNYDSGKFVSIRGVTALAVSPLAASAAIPDKVELSYQVPRDSKADDNQGRVDTVTTESTYFFKYPATVFQRKKNAYITVSGVTSGTYKLVRDLISPATAGTCGNAPQPPRYGPYRTEYVPGQPYTGYMPAPCKYGYETKQVPQYVPAYRTEVRETHYNGPAAQVSLTTQNIYGPAIELNSQYFSDKYAYCGSIYASECLPSPCELFGLEQVLLGKQETLYTYGDAREVIKTVTTTWRPILAAAQPTDWRSGIVRGQPQDFDQNLATYQSGLRLYKHSVVISEFYKEDNASVQKTTTYTSASTRGGGIGANLDAYAGIKTQEIRRSVSSVTVEIRPDSVNAATTEVVSEKTIVEMHGTTGGYLGADNGPYILKEDVPAPLLYNDRADSLRAANYYGDYLVRFIEGDSRGLTIGEALREQIAQDWEPNQPFRYYDPKTEKLMAFRSDACSWGADPSGCVVVINGVWIADMTGSVTTPGNLVGNATPVMPDPININPTHGDSTGVSDPDNQGSGFVPGTYINLATYGGSGTGATVDVVIAADGSVESIVLNQGGSDYEDGERINVDGALLGGGGYVSIRIEVDEEPYVPPTPPTPPTDPEPVVTGDTVTGRRFNFHVNIDLRALVTLTPSNVDGIRTPIPDDQPVSMELTWVVFVSGRIVQPGALVALENDGSIPIESQNNVVVDDTLIVVDDDVLFPSATP